jgi:TonB-dependent SusC/RagA subfamily outer membrane receptor
MKTKLNGFLTLLLAFVVQISFAQNKSVSGVVSDQSGTPLPGATVLVKGTNNGTTSDFDGNYTIQTASGDVLIFSFIGYVAKEVNVGDSANINVTLEEDAQALDEVVVTALGLERKKDNDISSATVVKADVIARSGEGGLLQGVAGKTSGVLITSSAGDPGAGAFIQIRGQNTILGDSSPLIIVDGVPVSNSNIGSNTAGVVQQSRLNDIPASDIESMTVLKGAAAAAVWGSGAANGEAD